jgi:hypothetical protein
LTVAQWNRDSIYVQIPDVTDGTYWLAIYDGSNKLIVAGPRTLAVRNDARTGGTPPAKFRIEPIQVPGMNNQIPGPKPTQPRQPQIESTFDPHRIPTPETTAPFKNGNISIVAVDTKPFHLGDQVLLRVKLHAEGYGTRRGAYLVVWSIPARKWVAATPFAITAGTDKIVDMRVLATKELLQIDSGNSRYCHDSQYNGKLPLIVYLSDSLSPASPRPVPFSLDTNPADNSSEVSVPVGPVACMVQVRLQHIKVNDDCDSVSPGDWYLSLSAGRRSGSDETILVSDSDYEDSIVIPSGNPYKIDTGEEVFVGDVEGSVNLWSVTSDSTLLVKLSAVDCDSSAPVAGAPGPIFGGKRCCCEDAADILSGGHDFPGQIVLVLRPGQWYSHNGTYVSSGQAHDCGRNAFEADIWIKSFQDLR